MAMRNSEGRPNKVEVSIRLITDTCATPPYSLISVSYLWESYTRKHQNYVGIDASHYSNGKLTIFQVTFARSHPVDVEGIMQVIEELNRQGNPVDRCVDLVFVCPTNNNIMRTQLLKGIRTMNTND